ncbi:MAG TPA: nucleoside 2-deoxyribosyltransferase [Candidatus Paceibacterota bacterium]
MNAYLAIKFKEDFSNRSLIENICTALEIVGVQTTVMVRDLEKWGKTKFTPQEMMSKAFEETDKADILIIEFSEKGVGLGIEAGYALAKGKPIIVIAKTGSEISDTLKGLAKDIIFYAEPDELSEKFQRFIYS